EDVFYLFFSATETSQAKAIEFVGRIFTREQARAELPGLAVRDAQAEAISDWGIPDMGKLARLAGITQPTLVANGNNDIMVPTVNSYLLAGHLPDAKLIIYPDAGHGFLFQYPHEFAAEVNHFLTVSLGEIMLTILAGNSPTAATRRRASPALAFAGVTISFLGLFLAAGAPSPLFRLENKEW